MMSSMMHHLLIFDVAALVAWAPGTFALIYFYPHMFYNLVRKAVVKRGLGIKAGGILPPRRSVMPASISPGSAGCESHAEGWIVSQFEISIT